ncbi:hypothetical protein LVJ94_03040 [Pendulispora rubella]|uniref:Uncharacterized protein n=1 Tax=Pendulispora rubella TaxID=2741070 RepID=A0ABZ2LAI1_9BACT
MRFISSIAIVSMFFALVVGCSASPDGEPETSETAAVPVQEGVSPQAICPLKWTCGEGFYTSRLACEGACGGTCYRDYACNGSCTCP